jgi:hypothetical protein
MDELAWTTNKHLTQTGLLMERLCTFQSFE